MRSCREVFETLVRQQAIVDEIVSAFRPEHRTWNGRDIHYNWSPDAGISTERVSAMDIADLCEAFHCEVVHDDGRYGRLVLHPNRLSCRIGMAPNLKYEWEDIEHFRGFYFSRRVNRPWHGVSMQRTYALQGLCRSITDRSSMVVARVKNLSIGITNDTNAQRTMEWLRRRVAVGDEVFLSRTESVFTEGWTEPFPAPLWGGFCRNGRISLDVTEHLAKQVFETRRTPTGDLYPAKSHPNFVEAQSRHDFEMSR